MRYVYIYIYINNMYLCVYTYIYRYVTVCVYDVVLSVFSLCVLVWSYVCVDVCSICVCVFIVVVRVVYVTCMFTITVLVICVIALIYEHPHRYVDDRRGEQESRDVAAAAVGPIWGFDYTFTNYTFNENKPLNFRNKRNGFHPSGNISCFLPAKTNIIKMLFV